MNGASIAGEPAEQPNMDVLPTAAAAPSGNRSPGSRCDPRRLIAVVAGGGLLWSSFPPTDWWPATFAGLALLGWVLAHRNTTMLGGLGFGFVFGVAFYLPLLPWTGALVGIVPWLALSTLCAAFTAVFGAAAVALRDQPGWPMWWATWWVAVELLKSTVPFGGFPWGVLAFGQSSGPLAQLAPWGGTSLISFTTALIGFTATVVLVGPGQARRRSAVAALSTALCLAALTAVAWQPGRSAPEKQTMVVAAVQGNVPRLGLDFNAQRRAVLDNHVQQTLRLVDDVRAGRAPQPDLVVWPEKLLRHRPIDQQRCGATNKQCCTGDQRTRSRRRRSEQPTTKHRPPIHLERHDSLVTQGRPRCPTRQKDPATVR